MRYAFAGDRKISVEILKFLLSKGFKPLALLTTEKRKSSHGEELRELSGLPNDLIFEGKEFLSKIEILKKLELDYIFGIHFPYIIPSDVLGIPKIGFLNLHPAYLPFNKGWHTPSWAILDNTPVGATLHFMTEDLDAGDIIHQIEEKILPDDTANSLYQRLLDAELIVFKDAINQLVNLKPARKKQIGIGTGKSKKDLKNVQEIDLDKKYVGEELINKLRALTTNNIEEAAFFTKNGTKYFVQVTIIKE